MKKVALPLAECHPYVKVYVDCQSNLVVAIIIVNAAGDPYKSIWASEAVAALWSIQFPLGVAHAPIEVSMASNSVIVARARKESLVFCILFWFLLLYLFIYYIF
jgi:hypothetical protein